MCSLVVISTYNLNQVLNYLKPFLNRRDMADVMRTSWYLVQKSCKDSSAGVPPLMYTMQRDPVPINLAEITGDAQMCCIYFYW